MNGPTIGELCAGYGGLGMGVKAALGGGRIAWVSDVDKGANRVLAHRFPDAPNIGDMTTVDWTHVEPVDVLTGGTPCQDLSHAGKRAGMTDGTRSNLWVSMREAIATIRPSLVVWENVGGAYSAAADSEMESDPGRLGDRPGGPVLRALGRVLGDLASLGYVGGWHGLRAADVGAPHGRLRVFVVAVPADQRHEWAGASRHGRTGPADSDSGPVTLLGTPTARMWKGSGPVGSGSHKWLLDHGNVEAQVLLLPTPAVNDMGRAYTPEGWDAWCATQQAKHGNGNGHGKSLEIEAQRLLPTPTTEPLTGNGHARHLGGEIKPDRWGDYAAAIARWERALGRPAPAPTEHGAKGNPRLSPEFTEWMMGLPAGWITDTPGVTRNEALKLCGNGVVPQQCEAAVRFLLAHVGEVAA